MNHKKFTVFLVGVLFCTSSIGWAKKKLEDQLPDREKQEVKEVFDNFKQKMDQLDDDTLRKNFELINKRDEIYIAKRNKCLRFRNHEIFALCCNRAEAQSRIHARALEGEIYQKLPSDHFVDISQLNTRQQLYFSQLTTAYMGEVAQRLGMPYPDFKVE